MTRDAEHTPTGYEDAASVVVNQAPAPSSLAGGEVRTEQRRLLETKIEQWTGNDYLGDDRLEVDDALELADAIKAVLAALSPEAPARMVGTIAHVSNGRSELAAHITAALTPRHEAPAEGAGERDPIRSVRTIMARAVERKDQEMLDHARIALDALRARSSAPEAREGEPVGVVYSLKADLNTAELPDGTLLYTHPAHPSADHAELTRLAEAAGEEALGNLLAVIHGDGGHRALEVGTKQAALEAEKIVAGLFAAPSADKLRDHLEWIETVLTDPVPGYTARIATAREYIDQALAALKAEGAK